jgi:hypothetical protein
MEVLWTLGKMPENWQTAIMCPIHKKGDKLLCSICKGIICLLNLSFKSLTNILHRWLVPYTEEILGDYHCGFRKGRSATNNLLMLRCIPEKFYELNIDLHLLSIDFKQAYDSINRTYLYESLKEFWIPKK